MRYSALVGSLLIACLVSGCMTAAVVATSPQLLSLKREPDFIAAMTAQVRADGQTETIRVTWRCTQKAAWTASRVEWYMTWVPAARPVVAAKRLSSGRFLVLVGGTGTDCLSVRLKGASHHRSVGLAEVGNTAYLEVIQNQPRYEGAGRLRKDPRFLAATLGEVVDNEHVAMTAEEATIAKQVQDQPDVVRRLLQEQG